MIKKIPPCVLALMFVLALPSFALAVGGQPKVKWSEDGDICRMWIAQFNTPDYPCQNTYDAASWFCGVNPARLTDEQKAKLSNESSGGQFWVFAQLVNGNTSSDFDLGLYPGLPAFTTIYGNYVYTVECQKSLFYAAQNDLHVILSGGSLGGSSNDGDFLEFDVIHLGSSVPSRFQGVTKVRIPKEKCNLLDLNPNLCVLRLTTFSGIRIQSYTFYIGVGSCTLEPSGNNYSFVTPSGSKYGSANINHWYSTTVQDGVLTVDMPDSSFVLSANSNGPRTDTVYTDKNYIICTYSGTGGGGGSDTFWPSPTGGEPDPPTPPEPGDPVIPEPEPPDPPDPPDPYDPIVEPEPTGTDPIDYTPWFRAILRELQNFHRDNIAVLNSINSQIVSSSNAIIADLNYMLDYGLGQIHDEFSATRAYLRECLEWLAEQMDFSFTADGYDDSSVVSYLKQILYELQKAPDVTTDPFDFFGWLNGLLGNLLSGLLGAVLGSLASFTEPLEALTGKFPFSLPWDIAAILALFVAPAQVPVFDIPFAGYGSVHVDLTGFDVVAQVVRALMLVLFAYGLTQRTKDMLDLIDKIVG